MYLLFIKTDKSTVVFGAKTAKAAKAKIASIREFVIDPTWGLMGPDATWHDGNTTIDLSIGGATWEGIAY